MLHGRKEVSFVSIIMFILRPDALSLNGSVMINQSINQVLAETLPPQFTPRSKYYATKTVWFREEIHKHGIKLLKIATAEQLGDIFTKGLSQPTFEYLRSKIVGW